ncbi:MAG: hypothetical protein ACFFA4_11335 [Promethearchaeota archaeon]
MKIQKSYKQRLNKTSLLFVILVLSFITGVSMNSINISNDKDNLSDKEFKDDNFPAESLNPSVLGNDSWWDYSFRYRRLIEVSNPYALTFVDYGVSTSFNYAQLLQAGMIYQDDLDDIRIVENGKLRNYYIVKDYPETGFATVYFDTNISQSTTELDTYMYFGNEIVGNAESDDPSSSFGWIKNGDFELDTSSDDKYSPFGWTFTDEPIDYLGIVSGDNIPYPNAANESAISYEYFRYKPIHISECDPDYLTDPPPNWDSALRIENGEYSYVWGSNLNALGGIGSVFDYAGTFFSYPFKVPIVQGGSLYLRLYRNIRTWRFEKRAKPQDDIDIDGFFIRLCNVSSYGSDVDSHTVLGEEYSSPEYVEAYGGYARYSPSGKMWDDEDYLQDHVTPGSQYATLSHTYNDGDLTGTIYYDLTPYMGQEIFLEAGAWGQESGNLPQEAGEKQGIFQLDYIGFNYTLTASIDQVQAHNSTLKIIARDVDGRIVSNAEVMLVNNSISKGQPGYEVATGMTDSIGRITFKNIPNGRYNITANYTLGSRESEVYNSYISGVGPFYLNGISYTEEITLDLWTIDFEITDWDGTPLSKGYIEVNETLGGDLLKTMILDQNGRAMFRWLNVPSYYFRVYYDNDDYYGNPLLLNESYIYRSDYDKVGVKYQDYSISVKDTNINPPGENGYSISEYIYTNGSRTEFGYEKIIKFNVSLTNMIDQLEDISIYYIDKYGTTGTSNHLIYFEDGYNPGEDNDFIELDVPLIDNSKLRSERYEVHGLLIEVNGLNFSQCDGTIEIETIETCNIYNRTNLARINIQMIDEYDNPISAEIHVVDTLSGNPLIDLTASSTTTGGWAYGSSGLPFWYLKNRIYNFTIDAYNLTNIVFDVDYIDPPQWQPQGITWFNYTLETASTITFKAYLPGVNTSYYLTSFSNSSGTEEAYWGDNVAFSVIFEYTDDNGNTWNPVADPSARCTIYIRRVGTSTDLIREFMWSGTGAGNFTIIINSADLSAGGSSRFYNVRIEGSLPGYPAPNSEGFLLELKAIPTIISAHDHDTQIELLDKSYTAHYDDYISIMVKYSIYETGIPLEDAYLTYEWLGLTPISFYADPINVGFYTFTLDTSDAQTTGLKVISITASYENYTTKSNFLVYLNILERETILNAQSDDLYYISSRIYVQDQKNFIFTYQDSSTMDIIGDLTISNYVWEELYENGTKIPGSFGSGTLIQNLNHSYTLDFNTELKPVGYYFLYLTLKQENYEQKNAFIYLEIMLREFTVTIQYPHLGSNNQIAITQGSDIYFEVHLWDNTRSEELATAEVKFDFRGISYILNPILTEPGAYNASVLTKDINTFLMAHTFVGKIQINAANFTSQEFSITITVKMQEIWPGMPTFYFIIITAAIVGVVGSIVGYRVIQQARIPKHVKKIRKIKNLIKSKKIITESFSVPTKDEMMVKLFGEDWKYIGLSIEEALGITDLKKKSSLENKITKERGENE